LDAPDDVLVSAHETVKLVPNWRTRAREIEAGHLVLFDGGAYGKLIVPFPVVAKYDPAFHAYLCHLLIIRRLVVEFEFVLGIVVKFDSKGRSRRP
jgi:hypothetical protein